MIISENILKQLIQEELSEFLGEAIGRTGREINPLAQRASGLNPLVKNPVAGGGAAVVPPVQPPVQPTTTYTLPKQQWAGTPYHKGYTGPRVPGAIAGPRVPPLAVVPQQALRQEHNSEECLS